MRVIHDVTDKEKRGRNQRDNHARDMPAPRAVANQIPAGGKKHRADKIKRSVDRGKVGNGRHQFNLQPSTFNLQPSTLNAQRPTLNVQRSTTRRASSFRLECPAVAGLLLLPRRSSHLRRLLKTRRTVESL